MKLPQWGQKTLPYSPFGGGLVGEPAADDAWELRPWKPGEADAMRAKWESR